MPSSSCILYTIAVTPGHVVAHKQEAVVAEYIGSFMGL